MLLCTLIRSSNFVPHVFNGDDETCHISLKPDRAVVSSLADSSADHRSSKSSVQEEDDDLPVCPICLGEYKRGDEICSSQDRVCAHIFHRLCIIRWLLEHNDCPCCRRDLLKSERLWWPRKVGCSLERSRVQTRRRRALSMRRKWVQLRIPQFEDTSPLA